MVLHIYCTYPWAVNALCSGIHDVSITYSCVREQVSNYCIKVTFILYHFIGKPLYIHLPYFLPSLTPLYLVMCVLIMFREESTVVPIIMETLLSIPEDSHLAIRVAVLDLISPLAEWLKLHTEFLGKRYCSK